MGHIASAALDSTSSCSCVHIPQDVRCQIAATLGPIATSVLVTERHCMPVWRVATEQGDVALKVDMSGTGFPARERAVLSALGDGSLAAAGDHSTGPWLATWWWDGASTFERWAPVRDGGIGRTRNLHGALRAAVDFCEAVADLHDRGWVHGDLQPVHCIHTAAGPRLIDFAVAYGPAGSVPDEIEAAYPYIGGKIDLNPPETAEAMITDGLAPKATQATDVYSLAASLWHCWTGGFPVDYASQGAADDSLPATERRRLIAQGLPLPAIPRGLEHADLRGVLAGALARNPSDRPRARELAERLAAVAR
ncbi:hypothetical protein [Yinghuangia soli]|uniref:Protein kinase domain-containing protein n=1 Tax=Yinghuangia soli TaxID=2908204 RepID=A0AA41Q8L4_9ACTN|nr:hypothetical protein [Yinghuangia soli]MCF2533614.1 hypothetical protein [Yinghuangia soli]